MRRILGRLDESRPATLRVLVEVLTAGEWRSVQRCWESVAQAYDYAWANLTYMLTWRVSLDGEIVHTHNAL